MHMHGSCVHGSKQALTSLISAQLYLQPLVLSLQLGELLGQLLHLDRTPVYLVRQVAALRLAHASLRGGLLMSAHGEVAEVTRVRWKGSTRRHHAHRAAALSAEARECYSQPHWKDKAFVNRWHAYAHAFVEQINGHGLPATAKSKQACSEPSRLLEQSWKCQ